MSRQKRSRKPAPLGPSQKPRVKKSERQQAQDKKIKKTKGRDSGSRNNPITKDTKGNQPTKSNDPRHGSKKPIALNAAEVETVVIPDFKPQVKLKKVQPEQISPEQELEQIEADQRLMELLDRTDAGEVLTGKDAKYFNAKTARHEELMDILGLSYGSDEDDWEDDESLDDDFDNDQAKSLIEQWEDDDGDDS